jgi:hypothetical protein
LTQGDISREEFSGGFDFSFYEDLNEILGVQDSIT